MSRFRIATFIACIYATSFAAAGDRPNILWITSEDNGPHLGCYGDDYATTPHLDGLAKRGMIYRNAWSTAPVCAPARTTIISGLYPPATGSEHMRSETNLPTGMKMYPQHLRDAGYYCTNNSKKDYNLKEPGQVWDESSRKAHWKNRKPGQPFFAIFNFTVSHESQIRRRPHEPVHDPAKVRVPAYHPDTPEVRQDWAQYYDKLTEMDTMSGKVLKELNEVGLADDTIIFYYGDHGSGMPRSKRWPYNSGLNIPLIVSVPEKFEHLAPSDYRIGGESNRLVGFIDLAPTLLSLIGQQPPDAFQGHAFMGTFETPAPEYAFGFRGRMDERYDLVRTVRDENFVYIRHFMPHKIYGQYIDYMFKTPTTTKWHELFQANQLSPAQAHFWRRKPVEELYDLRTDRDEVDNLAKSDEHKQVVQRFRKALRKFQLEIRDVGFLPEEEIHSRAAESSPYEVGHDPNRYPLKAIRRVAMIASKRGKKDLPKLRKALKHPDSAIRYWGVMGYINRGKQAVREDATILRESLTDNSASVRVLAAEALGKFGNRADRPATLKVLIDAANLKHNNVWVAMLSLNAIDEMDQKAISLLPQIRALPTKDPSVPQRYRSYVPNLIKKIVDNLD
ncbi:MAG: Choline-sulfatase [Verrucomicrobia subdivision 3 bacterium]|nr:Choline-sulfatase [Limisphaerales bacterium]MCS1415148.1 Choline-sulfatase [Limisphaerales bacterium]